MNEGTKSKLSAIMFTDIVNYSRFMEENEVTALSILDEHNALIFPLIAKNEGKLVKSIGDALMVDFNSTRSACGCALEIQQALAERNEETSKPFFVRIGIHLGDVWYKDNDIFGDGVNVAARLEPLAAPGGILISQDVYNQINNKLNTQTKFIGEQKLKNINKTIKAYELVTGYEQRAAAISDPAQDLKRKVLELADSGLNKGMRNKFGNDFKEIDTVNDPGERVKKKIFTVVNKFMDKAIEEWDKQPAEKKQKIIDKIDHEFEKSEHKPFGSHNRRQRKQKKENSDLAWGIVATTGFSIALGITGNAWILIPMMLIGVFPLLSGIGKLFKKKEKLPDPAEHNKKTQEKEILQYAARCNGRVTALQTASETTLSIEEAKEALDEMVKHGHAQMNVEDSGLLVYEFPEFAIEQSGNKLLD